MKQIDYTLIVACIKAGAPVVANELINALNEEIKLANSIRETKQDDIKEGDNK